jgi:hypothetical protein
MVGHTGTFNKNFKKLKYVANLSNGVISFYTDFFVAFLERMRCFL